MTLKITKCENIAQFLRIQKQMYTFQPNKTEKSEQRSSESEAETQASKAKPKQSYSSKRDKN